MAESKNHHYVPQFYFRRFSKDGKNINALLRPNGRLIDGAPIRGQASKAWFYGTAERERALSKIEGHCSAALRTLSELPSDAALDEASYHGVLTHLVLQRARTQSARESTMPFHNRLAQLFLEAELAKNISMTSEKRELMMQALPFLELDPAQVQTMEMGVAMESVDILADLRVLLLDNKTNRPFAFGDAPVVLYNPYCRDVTLRSVLGYAKPGLMVLMPLDSRTYIALIDDEVYDVRGAKNARIALRELSDVAALNKLQIHAASHCVYFEDTAFRDYVHCLWQMERYKLTNHSGKVVEAPGFSVETGESLGDIVHGFTPQLNFRPLFSFLKHPILGDADARQHRRASFESYAR